MQLKIEFTDVTLALNDYNQIGAHNVLLNPTNKHKMAEESVKVCKLNQTGFCKFGIHCGKQHENQVCDDIYDCKKDNCIKRHPQICRHYEKNEKCRFKEGCAYIHEKKGAKQGILNEQIQKCSDEA